MTDKKVPVLKFNLFDKVCYHEENYYSEQIINRIEILPDKIYYYTDAPNCFTNDDIGKTIFASFIEARNHSKAM